MNTSKKTKEFMTPDELRAELFRSYAERELLNENMMILAYEGVEKEAPTKDDICNRIGTDIVRLIENNVLFKEILFNIGDEIIKEENKCLLVYYKIANESKKYGWDKIRITTYDHPTKDGKKSAYTKAVMNPINIDHIAIAVRNTVNNIMNSPIDRAIAPNLYVVRIETIESTPMWNYIEFILTKSDMKRFMTKINNLVFTASKNIGITDLADIRFVTYIEKAEMIYDKETKSIMLSRVNWDDTKNNIAHNDTLALLWPDVQDYLNSFGKDIY